MTLAKILIFLGLGVLILGLILHFMPNLFDWFGKLPGDIKIQDKNSFIFIPITSMILVSIILSVLFNLLFRK
jgi:hypothetical protein